MSKENESVAEIFERYCFNKILEFQDEHINEFGNNLFDYASDVDNLLPDRKLILSFDLPEKEASESYLECLEEMLANVFAGAANKITIRTVKETCPRSYDKHYPGKSPIIININFKKEADRIAIEYCQKMHAAK